ncbi:Uncharacterized protein DBV15_01038 [Temnothorax longispinosus]|uniref:Uncharacterized protein n=1 Tax=Temnothorax longispinosus TaxID=300112 RepID=A0A4V3S651_9HYME|nr:Uncharacterized protein DBV15_01038 [Temnothorax longispinosus]
MIGVRWIPLRRRDFTQFHNYPRYRLTVVWTVSAGVVISLEITPAKLSPRLLRIISRSELETRPINIDSGRDSLVEHEYLQLNNDVV